MNTDPVRLLDSIYKSSTDISDKIFDFYSQVDIENNQTLQSYSSILSRIQKKLRSVDTIIENYKQTIDLIRSKSLDVMNNFTNICISEIIKFWLLGQQLQNPIQKQKFLQISSESSDLNNFLTFFNQFCKQPDTNLLNTSTILEKDMKNYLKRSNRLVPSTNFSYNSVARFCNKANVLISELDDYEHNDKNEFNKSFFKLQPLDKYDSIIENKVIYKNPELKNYCKIFESCDEAVFDMISSSSLLIGGFGLVGSPENLLKAIHKKSINDLNIYSCLAGTNYSGLGQLISDNRVKSVHVSHIGTNTELERQYLNGEIELEFITQGTLVERFRASAAGIHSFYTASGAGTFLEEGRVPVKFSLGGKAVEKYVYPKDFITENEKKYFLEKAIKADFGIIKA